MSVAHVDSSSTLAILISVSAAAGFIGALLGIGGGIVLIPVLTLLFGLPLREAIGVSIVAVIATSSGAAASYVRDHLTNIRVAIFLEVATTLGGATGAFLSGVFSPRVLTLLFVSILLYSVWQTLRPKSQALEAADDDLTLQKASQRDLATTLKLHATYRDPVHNKLIPYRVRHPVLGFFIMAGAGILSGLLGVGSGALKVTAMDQAMGLPFKISTATSNFMIGVTAAASAGAYYRMHTIPWDWAGPVSVGTVLGATLGTRFMARISSQRLRLFFAFFVLLTALQMLYRAFGGGGS